MLKIRCIFQTTRYTKEESGKNSSFHSLHSPRWPSGLSPTRRNRMLVKWMKSGGHGKMWHATTEICFSLRPALEKRWFWLGSRYLTGRVAHCFNWNSASFASQYRGTYHPRDSWELSRQHCCLCHHRPIAVYNAARQKHHVAQYHSITALNVYRQYCWCRKSDRMRRWCTSRF